MIRYAALALMACTACTPADRPTAPTAPNPETGAKCDATGVQSLVGRAADEATVAEARRGSGAANVRRYNTGDMLTQDFRVDRLNVEVGADGKIAKIGCG